MRGKGFGVVRRNGRPRITPAYAGKRGAAGSIGSRSQDHPRVCGEKAPPMYNSVCAKGSPPRMRGKDNGVVASGDNYGITPAYAGKRAFKARWAASRRDHPRVCGEKPLRPQSRSSRSGSPPRMRGKVHSIEVLRKAGGITPAYAGKRLVAFQLHQFAWDHPRVCGEKTGVKLTPRWWTGSPPRMRGKGCKVLAPAVRLRITPAYAGKSATSKSRQ